MALVGSQLRQAQTVSQAAAQLTFPNLRSKSQIEDFADALSAYPLNRENLPEIIGGLGDQVNLYLKVYPINGIGDLAIQVKLATDLWNEQRPESQHIVQLEILTHYNSIEPLTKELKDLINGRINIASLETLD